jgi:hypothetical protein
MLRKKSKRGRRPGQLGKAHKALREAFSNATSDYRKNLIAQGITPELNEEWHHHDLAFLGNFSREVATTALQLGRLVERYKKILVEKRWNLEANRRVEIPLPLLPVGENFNKSEINLLHQTGHDALWTMQGSEYSTALSLLSFLIRAVANDDVTFFDELARRVRSSFALGVPLASGTEPQYSALTELKKLFENPYHDGHDPFFRKFLPEIIPILKKPPSQRPPLKLSLIGDYVRVFGRIKMSDRALSRAAKIMGIPIASRGRPKCGT